MASEDQEYKYPTEADQAAEAEALADQYEHGTHDLDGHAVGQNFIKFDALNRNVHQNGVKNQNQSNSSRLHPYLLYAGATGCSARSRGPTSDGWH
jgi:hypothetical protein